MRADLANVIRSFSFVIRNIYAVRLLPKVKPVLLSCGRLGVVGPNGVLSIEGSPGPPF
jgi:hypothetical protein